MPHQFTLQLAQVVMAESQVVREIIRTHRERLALDERPPALDAAGRLVADGTAQFAQRLQ